MKAPYTVWKLGIKGSALNTEFRVNLTQRPHSMGGAREGLAGASAPPRKTKAPPAALIVFIYNI